MSERERIPNSISITPLLMSLRKAMRFGFDPEVDPQRLSLTGRWFAGVTVSLGTICLDSLVLKNPFIWCPIRTNTSPESRQSLVSLDPWPSIKCQISQHRK